MRFGNVNEGEHESFPDEARGIVGRYAGLPGSEVYVVWFAYTLGNWKALVSTTEPDDRYYEVTHNAAKAETYLDVYVKHANICIPEEN